MNTGKPQVTGTCLCRAVEFSASLPSKWCAHCHCSMCRKEHGAGYVFFDEHVNWMLIDEALKQVDG